MGAHRRLENRQGTGCELVLLKLGDFVLPVGACNEEELVFELWDWDLTAREASDGASQGPCATTYVSSLRGLLSSSLLDGYVDQR